MRQRNAAIQVSLALWPLISLATLVRCWRPSGESLGQVNSGRTRVQIQSPERQRRLHHSLTPCWHSWERNVSDRGQMTNSPKTDLRRDIVLFYSAHNKPSHTICMGAMCHWINAAARGGGAQSSRCCGQQTCRKPRGGHGWCTDRGVAQSHWFSSLHQWHKYTLAASLFQAATRLSGATSGPTLQNKSTEFNMPLLCYTIV